MYSLNGDDAELSKKALTMIRLCMEMDEKVGVKFIKLKLLSNLLIHTLPEGDSEKSDEIYKIALSFKENKYR